MKNSLNRKEINAYQPQPKQLPVQLKVANQTNTQHTILSTTLKISLLIVAGSFLVYSIYWAINGVTWAISITQLFSRATSGQIGFLTSWDTTHLTLLLIQEYASVVNCFLQLSCGLFAIYSAILYLRNDARYLGKLRVAIIFMALFFLLLVPASIHHLVGSALSWQMVSIYVGLSYLLQALFIVPALLILSQKMRKPQNPAAIQKWATIAVPLFAFALWLKYAFLWIDTLSPMNLHESNPMSTVGTVNSLFTLLIAALVIAIGCLKLNKNRTSGTKVLAAGLILVGAFFIVFSLVAFFVPIYASFWYLTDFWMITLPILGIVLLWKSLKETPA